MLSSLRFSRIVFIASLVAAILYIASYVLWLSAGVTLDTSTHAALELAAGRPGLWGIGYLLQAFAFLLWALWDWPGGRWPTLPAPEAWNTWVNFTPPMIRPRASSPSKWQSGRSCGRSARSGRS